MKKDNTWTSLFILMAVIAFAAIFLASQESNAHAIYRARLEQGLNIERKAPSDIVQGGELTYNEDRVMINYSITYPCWNGSVFVTEEYGNGSTTSMIPTISKGHQALCLGINSMECLQEGDIIVHRETGNTHRIIEKGEDEKGLYILTIGDNNFDYSEYDVKLRHHEELCVVFGLVY